MDSDFGRSMWFSFAPLHPESFTQAMANRVSVTPASSAVLPPREWPTTPKCFASRSGSVSTQSSTRLAPHAQAESAPQLLDVRSFAQQACTPCVQLLLALSSATSPFQNASAA